MKNPSSKKRGQITFDSFINEKKAIITSQVTDDRGSYWDPPHREANHLSIIIDGKDVLPELDNANLPTSFWDGLDEEAFEAAREYQDYDPSED
jgi:hypothetical protein